MCRKTVTLGLMAVAFGAGLLIATIFPPGFLVFVFAAVLICVGILLIK